MVYFVGMGYERDARGGIMGWNGVHEREGDEEDASAMQALPVDNKCNNQVRSRQ